MSCHADAITPFRAISLMPLIAASIRYFSSIFIHIISPAFDFTSSRSFRLPAYTCSVCLPVPPACVAHARRRLSPPCAVARTSAQRLRGCEADEGSARKRCDIGYYFTTYFFIFFFLLSFHRCYFDVFRLSPL